VTNKRRSPPLNQGTGQLLLSTPKKSEADQALPIVFEERLGDIADLKPDLMSFMVAGLGEFLRYFARLKWSASTRSPLQRLRVNFDGLFEGHFHGALLVAQLSHEFPKRLNSDGLGAECRVVGARAETLSIKLMDSASACQMPFH